MQEFTEKRLLWIMSIASFVGVIGSLQFADWRVTSGLWLGCVLSLINFFWLKATLGKLLQAAVVEGGTPAFIAFRYLSRYLAVAAVVAFAYFLNIISIVATLVGLLTLALAICIEGFILIFFAIIGRNKT